MRFSRASIVGCLGSLALLSGCSADDIEHAEILARNADGFSDGAVQGRFVTRIASMYDGSAKRTHHLRLPDGEVELDLPADVFVERDSLVRATGAMGEGNVWQVDEWQVVAPPPSPIIDGEPLPLRNIGAIIVFWGEESGLQNPTAKNDLFVSDVSTNVFYGENSYGRETFVGQVFGPYQIDDPGGCDPYTIGMDARQAMADNGHNPDEFLQLMYHFPDAGCSFAGLADLGSPQFPARDSWYHSSFGCVVRNQELGHNYGMGHSHSYSCGYDEMGEPIAFASSGCEHVEYGDPYDPMGGGCGHINAVQKLFMGWLEGCNLVSTTSDGTFNLLPLELPCDGTQALRFPAWDGRWYYLEYRAQLGDFDDSQGKGVLVRIAGEIENQGPAPYVLDRIGEGGFLGAGESFTDPEGTVSFTVDEILDTHAVISVTFPGGGNGSPQCMDGSDPGTEAGAIGSLVCADAPYPADDLAPVVELTYPHDGDMFDAGADFVITAEVSDDRIISDVVLYLDSTPVETLYAPPWEWTVTNIPAGSYEFGIAAHDGRNQGISDAVRVQVGPLPSADTSGGIADTTDGMGEGGGTTSDAESDDSEATGAPQDDAGIDDGCGCTSSPRRMPGLAMLAFAALALRGSRRRR